MVFGDPVVAGAVGLAGAGLPGPGGSTLLPPAQVSV